MIWFSARNILIGTLIAGIMTGCFLGDKDGEISGIVINSADKGLSGVLISTSPATSNTYTDGNGEYKLTGISKFQEYIVYASKDGYTTSSASVVLERAGTLSCGVPAARVADIKLSLSHNGVSTISDASYSVSNGFDFSKGTTTDIVADPNNTDMWYWYNPNATDFKYRLVAETRGGRIKDLGDKGLTTDTIDSASEGGSFQQTVGAAVGHSYIVQTLEGHYAKFRIKSITGTTNSVITIQWSYQSSGDSRFVQSYSNNDRNCHELQSFSEIKRR